MAATASFICMRWGTRYPAVYVNRLYAGIARHIDRPFRFVCFTDDPSGLAKGIEAHPLPDIDLPERVRWTPWRKLSIWQTPLADLQGDVLFLDVDLLVTGNLGEMFDHAPGRYCVIDNWTQPGQGVGNTSCFRFRIGKHSDIYDRFQRDPGAILDRWRIEQHYVTDMIKQSEGQTFWPPEWCVSFKHTLIPRFPMNWVRTPELPEDAKIVAFTGRPDIDEAEAGVWPAPWYKKFYKHARPAPWVGTHWRD